MSRDDLLTTNAKIMQTVSENVKKHAPNSIAIIISNPLDAMVTLFKKITGFRQEKLWVRQEYLIHQDFQLSLPGNSVCLLKT